MNKKYIIIKADTNDADYVSSKNIVTDKNLEIIRKVCKVIKNDTEWGTNDLKDTHNNPDRWVESGDLTQKEVDYFNDLTPSSEYGIHSIESVELLIVTEEEKLL